MEGCAAAHVGLSTVPDTTTDDIVNGLDSAFFVERDELKGGSTHGHREHSLVDRVFSSADSGTGNFGLLHVPDEDVR